MKRILFAFVMMLAGGLVATVCILAYDGYRKHQQDMKFHVADSAFKPSDLLGYSVPVKEGERAGQTWKFTAQDKIIASEC